MALYNTLTTTHESQDYRLRRTVQRIRDSFEARDLDALIWIPGTDNIADALTKRNIELQKKLALVCGTGQFPKFPEQCRVDSDTWL